MAKVSEFEEELKPKLVEVDGTSIGVYKVRGKYYAYENVCDHRGGPVCEGSVMGLVQCKVSANGRRLGDYVSDDKVALVCPWHGVEYDIETGVCFANRDLSLRRFDVKVEGEEIMVDLAREII